MCEQGVYDEVEVFVYGINAAEGKDKFKLAKIDRCIAPIIRALQDAKIWTTSCCCGHGKREGEILLLDGRALIVTTFENLEDAKELFIDKQKVREVIHKICILEIGKGQGNLDYRGIKLIQELGL